MDNRSAGDGLEQSEFHPMVSIIVPVYNGANYMREAIDSALNQTYDNIEVIVINDGSRDGGKTERAALSYGDRIRYFSKHNGGVATALNLGIEKMKGEYFSWLSHDDIYAREKIAHEVEQLRGHSDRTAVVAEGCKIIDANGTYLYTSNISDRYESKQLENGLFCLLYGGINACATLIHKSHFKRVGKFDPSLRTTQDFDLLFRILRGQKILFLETSNVFSRTHAEQGSKAQLEHHIGECGTLWIQMMTELSDGEKSEINGSPYLFYRKIWEFLSTERNYPKASGFAHRRMLAEGMKEYESSGNPEFLTMIAYECRTSVSEIERSILPNRNGDRKKLRVFFQIGFRGEKGGLNKAVIQMANMLSDTYDVYLGNWGGDQQGGYKTGENVTEVMFDMPEGRIESYIELLTLLQIDVYIFSYCYAYQWLPIFEALKTAGIRSIAWSHEDYFLPLWRENLWRGLSGRCKYLPIADAVIWLNRNSLSLYRARFENGVCIPNQIPEGCAGTYDRNRQTGKGEKKLLAIGRFDDGRKGLGDLLKAFAVIRESHEDAELYIVGTCDLQLPLDQASGLTCGEFIEKAGFNENCLHITGWVENIADYYNMGALHVMPSYYEGFGLVVLEAAANGVPTVAYDGSGMADIISNGFDGILVEWGNWQEMAKQISECLDKPEKISAMRENIPALLGKYSREAIVAQWRELIDTITEENDEKKRVYFSRWDFQSIGHADLKRVVTEYENTIIKVHTKGMQVIREEYEVEIGYCELAKNTWREECLAMQQSLSWRITKPLRWLKNILKTGRTNTAMKKVEH